MAVHFVQVAIEDAPGSMGEAAALLSDVGVNIEAFAVDAAGARFLTDDPQGAVAALSMAGYTSLSVEVLTVDLPNRPGELARLGKVLGEAGVNIISTFGVTHDGDGRVYLRVDDKEKARRALRAMGAR